MLGTLKALCLSLVMLLAAAPAFAKAPAIPNSPPLKAADIIKLLDGRTFSFTAYDMPLTGTATWDSRSKSVSGNYDFSGAKGKYTADWIMEGDKSCTQAPHWDKACETVYKYQNGYMEVNDKGKVHAVSVPQ
ncbi:MAG: hypothetical protein ABWY00_05595 [Dongiaceae bacterium]